MTRRVTNAQRRAAAARAAGVRARTLAATPLIGRNPTTLFSPAPAPMGVMDPLGMPDYLGTIPNYANSPLPTIDNGVDTVVVATGASFADALSASPLAGAYGAPVLLTPTASLPSEVADEILRLGATQAVVVGGTGAVSEEVFHQLVELLGTGKVTRIAGATRYATAALVATRIQTLHALDGTVFVATGLDYPDAHSASADAWRMVRPILLVKGKTAPPETLSALASLSATRAVILGGTGVVPATVAVTIKAALTGPRTIVRLAGADRYDTSSEVASWSAGGEGLDWKMVGVASGQTFPDALSGGPAMGRWGGVLLLTAPSFVPAATTDALTSNRAAIQEVRFYGGTGAISEPVRTEILGEVHASTKSFAGGDRYGTAVAASEGSFKVGPLPGTGIRKFVDSMPGLGPSNANDLGQYITVASPDTSTYPGSDYYEIGLVEYTEQLHRDLPPTRLRGYRQLNTTDTAVGRPSYLGPTIIAQRDRPVRVKFTNMLATGTAGDLFIPVDTTVMGAGNGPDGTAYSQNRATLHLHGGATPWISDGTPHQWTTPADEDTHYPRGVSVVDVPDMPDPGPGSLTFFYTNQQSARLMFYHDHAYGLTRLNVYAGEAAGYLVEDPVEQTLVNGGTIGTMTVAASTIPTEQIPLVIQDKTFVPAPSQLASQDPTWDPVKYGGFGQLWFPHVYMPNQNPSDPNGVNAMGRWDYGPWFWPPMDPSTLLGKPVEISPGVFAPGTPNPSLTPEAFMDTPLVNGTAYPYLKVQRKAYRLRVLNASNDRSVNLQLYYAKSDTPDSLDASGLPSLQKESGEVTMVPAVRPSESATWWPEEYPTDNREGGVPDPRASGPEMIQIGTEGGFLPAPVKLPNTPIGYEYNRRNIVVLNVTNHTLMLGPAERADVIVDFSRVPAGSKLIMYNDSPAPMPAFDTRYDYYTGDPDQVSSGGAPSTLAGYGPNTRTIMQFQVDGTTTATPSFDETALAAALPVAYKASQDPPVIPQTAYGGSTNVYARIESRSLTFTPDGTTTPIAIPLARKAIQELFELDYGRMNATLGVELPVTNFQTQMTIPLGYIDPTTENILDSGAAGPVTLGDGTQIWKITHNGVDTHAIHVHLFNAQIINRVGWDGQIRPPDANELGWKETIRMNPLEDAIIALRPVAPTLPFKLGDSLRPPDPTQPTTATFQSLDPITGQAYTVTNTPVTYEWEYVWHCHLLGHEENDMMRPIAFKVSPAAPSSLTATATTVGPPAVALEWVDRSTKPAATSFLIQRALDPAFSSSLESTAAPGGSTTWLDGTVSPSTSYYYRVRAENPAAYSVWSNTATATTGP
jgi:FtsP/CotA-like multicopper oxidase with cupredoxin domain/putative cell wall-binding protein